MAAPSVAQVTQSQYEQVRPVMEELFENKNPTITGRIRNASVQRLGRYLYRCPIVTRPGGAWNVFNPDGGSFPPGTSAKVQHLTAGYKPISLAFMMTQEQVKTTESSEVAITPALAYNMSQALTVAMKMMDISWFQDGTGVLTAGASAVSGGNVFTFATPGDRLGTDMLTEGMAVDGWASTLATKRVPADASQAVVIENINYAARQVTLSQALTGAATGDVFAFGGLDTAGNPATLTSFNAGWPTPVESQTANQILGGDSYVHGLYYVTDDTPTNYYLGKEKGTVSQLLAERVTANGALTFSHGLRLIDQLFQRWDESKSNGIEFIFHQEQRRAVWEIGRAISNKYLTGSRFGEIQDLGPTGYGNFTSFNYCDRPSHVSKRQRRDRVDATIFADWGRTVAWPLEVWDWLSGRRFIEGRDANGRPTSNIEFFWTTAFDYLNYSPGGSGYISDLT